MPEQHDEATACRNVEFTDKNKGAHRLEHALRDHYRSFLPQLYRPETGCYKGDALYAPTTIKQSQGSFDGSHKAQRCRPK